MDPQRSASKRCGHICRPSSLRSLGGSPNHISVSGLVPVEELGERGPNCLVRQLLAAGWNISLSRWLEDRSRNAFGKGTMYNCVCHFLVIL